MTITRFQFKARGKQFVLASEHDEEVARLNAEVETIRKDRDCLFASHKSALADIQRLYWELQTAKESKSKT